MTPTTPQTQAQFHNKIPAVCKPQPQVVITSLTQGIPANANPDYLLLAPNSGLYINASGQLDVNWATVRAQLDKQNDSEAGMATDCQRNIAWSITPAQLSQGDNLTLSMAGLKPYEDAKLVLSYGADKQYVWDVVADRLGRVEGAKLRITTQVKGTYKVTPIVTCAVVAPLVETFEVITGNEDVYSICDGNVTIIPSFVSTSIEDGANGQLKLVVTNTHGAAVTNASLGWTALPDGIKATSSNLPELEINAAGSEFRINSVASLAANSQSTTIINFKATNQTFDDIVARFKLASGAGSYVCGGNIYQAGGGTTTTTVAAGLEEINKLSIADFSVTGLTSGAVTAGTNLTFTLKVKNEGNTKITSIAIGPIQLNNGNSVVTTMPANAGILASAITLLPGATHTLTAVASFDLTDWGTATSFAHTIHVNASSITGTKVTKTTTQVVCSNSSSLGFTINKVAATTATPPTVDP